MTLPSFTRRQQLLLRWGGFTALAVLVLGIAALLSRSQVEPVLPDTGETSAGITSVLSRQATAEMAKFRFDEVREAAGIDFQHFPATRQSLLPEDMGSGLAWGDYDNDGDPDLYLVNFFGPVTQPIPEQATTGRSALYRNEGDGGFTDVSQQAGVDRPTFGQAAAWGDYDNDGDLDLYVTNYGPNLLYRNNGDGTFTDVTQAAGTGDTGFSSGCAWGDYNNDGHIDLYVSSYVQFESDQPGQARGARQYQSEIPYTINPSSYPPAANRLYRNNGDGTFTDVAAEAGVANPEGRSLGNAWFDFDNDDLIDLYVANDVSANGVFRNLGDGGFADIGASSLAADYRGAMGLAAGDIDRDEDIDLFVTHWVAQENAFFENMTSERLQDDQGRLRLFFMDTAETIGLGQISLKMVGWATGLVDLDNDGYLDLWVVNGNTLEMADDNTRLKPQYMQLFRHEPGKGFFEVGRYASPVLEQPIVGRGGAHADYDGDGRVDIAVLVHGGQPLLFHNTLEGDNHWLGVRLRQQGGNTHALGARVSIRTGAVTQTAHVGVGGSYLSQHHTDLHFGLGEEASVTELSIHWPDGNTERHTNVPADRLVTYIHPADYPRHAAAH